MNQANFLASPPADSRPLSFKNAPPVIRGTAIKTQYNSATGHLPVYKPSKGPVSPSRPVSSFLASPSHASPTRASPRPVSPSRASPTRAIRRPISPSRTTQRPVSPARASPTRATRRTRPSPIYSRSQMYDQIFR